MERTFKMIKVIDNFLDKNDFNVVQEAVMDANFPWFHFDQPVNTTHLQSDWDKTPQEIENEDKKVGNDNQTFQHFKDKNVFEIMNPITSKLKVKELIRVKINSYPNQGKLIEHMWHVDTDYKHKGCLLALNTCDGYTKFKDGDTKVDSVANRAILFDPSIEHTGTNTTTAQRRVNININYF